MDAEVKKLLLEAIDAIKRGDVEDALIVLERVVHPKFHSSPHAHGAYLMRDADGPSDPLRDYFAEALGHQVAS